MTALIFYGLYWIAAPVWALYTASLGGPADWLIFDVNRGAIGESFLYWVLGIVPAAVWWTVLGGVFYTITGVIGGYSE